MNTDIFFERFGSGPNVIMLHGFPMDHLVWREFAKRLATYFTIFTPDLPGLGQSSILPGEFSIADVASAMNKWIEDQGIESPSLIGHSMGGYVALEMIDQYPNRYKSLVLFHSTAYEDSAEKKESRTKVLKFIEDNGVLAFTSNFIQPLFVDQNHSAIPAVRDITMQAEAGAVTGFTRAMRDRRDNSKVIREFPGPILLIGGDQDKSISIDSLRDLKKENEKVMLHVLKDTGHMGMFEKTEETLALIKSFLFESNRPGGRR